MPLRVAEGAQVFIDHPSAVDLLRRAVHRAVGAMNPIETPALGADVLPLGQMSSCRKKRPKCKGLLALSAHGSANIPVAQVKPSLGAKHRGRNGINTSGPSASDGKVDPVFRIDRRASKRDGASDQSEKWNPLFGPML